MTIPFIGGPYDGLLLAVADVTKHLLIVSIPGREGTRGFTCLPSPRDWPRVLAGRMRVDESPRLHYYELISTPWGLQFQNDRGGRGYRRALADDGAGDA